MRKVFRFLVRFLASWVAFAVLITWYITARTGLSVGDAAPAGILAGALIAAALAWLVRPRRRPVAARGRQ